MPTLDEVARIACALPEVTEGERFRHRTWFVAGKGFVWERPLSKADLKRLGDATPPGDPILALRVEDLGEKEAILAEGRPGFFTITHFDGYPAVLVELSAIDVDDLADLIEDAWTAQAPKRLLEEWRSS
jgi:hypothetical protein